MLDGLIGQEVGTMITSTYLGENKFRGFVSMDVDTFSGVWRYISSQQHEVSIAMFREGQQRYFEISFKG